MLQSPRGLCTCTPARAWDKLVNNIQIVLFMGAAKYFLQSSSGCQPTIVQILMPVTSASSLLQVPRHLGEITVSLKANSYQITGCDVMSCVCTCRAWVRGSAEMTASVLYLSVDTSWGFRSLLVDAVRRVVSTRSVISHLRQALLWGAEEEAHCSQCSWPELGTLETEQSQFGLTWDVKRMQTKS